MRAHQSNRLRAAAGPVRWAAALLLLAAPAWAAPSLVQAPNAAGGFGSPANNHFLYPPVDFGGFLYATTGGVSPATGGEVWRSADGVSWTRVASGGFESNPNTWFILTLKEFGGALYAGTLNALSGGAVWRSFNGTSWTRVSAVGFGKPSNWAATWLEVYDGYLYAGTWNVGLGSELWRTANGTTWSPVVTGGYGRGAATRDTPIIKVIDGDLYVTTENFIHGGRVLRSTNGTTFTPVSPEGFGNPDNVNVYGITEFQGDLYASTWNLDTGGEVWRLPSGGAVWESVVAGGFQPGNPNQENIFYVEAFQSGLFVCHGGEPQGLGLKVSFDGETFSPVGALGFGNPNLTVCPVMREARGDLWIGAGSTIEGGQLWKVAGEDFDFDGVVDVSDNCPVEPNAGQEDGDSDGAGDVCDICPEDPDNDQDLDGVCGDVDNCPETANADQANADGDPAGDACDCHAEEPLAYPGKQEVCGDGIDNDCSGKADDGCTVFGCQSAPEGGRADGAGVGLVAVILPWILWTLRRRRPS